MPQTTHGERSKRNMDSFLALKGGRGKGGGTQNSVEKSEYTPGHRDSYCSQMIS